MFLILDARGRVRRAGNPFSRSPTGCQAKSKPWSLLLSRPIRAHRKSSNLISIVRPSAGVRCPCTRSPAGTFYQNTAYSYVVPAVQAHPRRSIRLPRIPRRGSYGGLRLPGRQLRRRTAACTKTSICDLLRIQATFAELRASTGKIIEIDFLIELDYEFNNRLFHTIIIVVVIDIEPPFERRFFGGMGAVFLDERGRPSGCGSGRRLPRVMGGIGGGLGRRMGGPGLPPSTIGRGLRGNWRRDEPSERH